MVPLLNDQRQNLGRYCKGHNLVNRWKNNSKKFINLFAIVATAAKKVEIDMNDRCEQLKAQVSSTGKLNIHSLEWKADVTAGLSWRDFSEK